MRNTDKHHRNNERKRDESAREAIENNGISERIHGS